MKMFWETPSIFDALAAVFYQTLKQIKETQYIWWFTPRQ